MSESTSTLLDVQDLTVEFATRRGIVRAVQNVNITVGKGETVVFAEPTPDLPKKLDV